MKNTATRLRSLCAALAALVLLLALAVPAFAAENGFADLYYRLNDSAEVLTEDEDSELEASLEELSVRQSFDVTIATIDSLESEGYTSMEEYADDLYDYCQFGYGENRDGVLLLVSIGDRKWHISTCGYGITAFTDAGIQYIGEQMTPRYGRRRLRRRLPHLYPVDGRICHRRPRRPPLRCGQYAA